MDLKITSCLKFDQDAFNTPFGGSTKWPDLMPGPFLNALEIIYFLKWLILGGK